MRQRTLSATDESALTQDVFIEIVVVDDGSKDATFEVARSFEAHIKLIAGPNRGALAVRNAGIEHAWVLIERPSPSLIHGHTHKLQ